MNPLSTMELILVSGGQGECSCFSAGGIRILGYSHPENTVDDCIQTCCSQRETIGRGTWVFVTGVNRQNILALNALPPDSKELSGSCPDEALKSMLPAAIFGIMVAIGATSIINHFA